jgi:hypothetical protein
MSATENRAAANLAVVGGIDEAFGRGDIDFILGRIVDDCAWESWLENHGQQAGLPPMKPRQGRAGVADFFAYVATMQIRDFQVLDMLASDRQVAAEVPISIPCRTAAASPTRSCICTRSTTRGGSTACVTTSIRRSRSTPTGWGSGAGHRPKPGTDLASSAHCRRRR